MFKQCKKCKRMKFDSYLITQFYTRFEGLYIWSPDLCKSCANELRDKAVDDYFDDLSIKER